MVDRKTASDAIDQNIASVHQVRKATEDNRRKDQKFIDAVAEFLGSTRSFYLHLIVYGGLLAIHFFSSPENAKNWYATTSDLSFLFSFEAIILSVFVLINQSSMKQIEQKNTDLDLQMSLLIEHEVTRIARVTDLIAKRLEVDTRKVGGLADVKKDVDPKEVLERISQLEDELAEKKKT